MNCLGLERLALAAISAGHCFKITEYARDYARERIQFGQPISQFQVIQHKLADMQIMSETARQMVYRVADLLDMGQPVVTEASIAKIMATENNFKCADMGMQIMGGAGYSNEYDMQMFFRDSRVGPIGGGTNEIQRNIIAKRWSFNPFPERSRPGSFGLRRWGLLKGHLSQSAFQIAIASAAAHFCHPISSPLDCSLC